MQLVAQLVCLGVGKDLWLELDETLSFLDIALQHLQPVVAQPAECPSILGVTGMRISVCDSGGSVQSSI